MVEPHVVTLRATRTGDLDELFRLRHDDTAIRMAAYTADDVADRGAFDARWARLRADPSVRLVTIRADGEIVGDAARWTDPDDGPVFAYRIDRAHRGRSIATRALRLFLDTEPRPMRTRAATDDEEGLAVLRSLGFTVVGRERTAADPRDAGVDEVVLELR